MIRHVRGEALSIGDVLSSGPSWYYQKQFFTGQAVSPPATLELRFSKESHDQPRQNQFNTAEVHRGEPRNQRPAGK
jgi:hypothetical protein